MFRGYTKSAMTGFWVTWKRWKQAANTDISSPLRRHDEHVSKQLLIYAPGIYRATLQFVWCRVSDHLVNVSLMLPPL